MKRLFVFFLLFVAFNTVAGAKDTQHSKIMLIVNGHGHLPPNDLLSEFDKTWKNSKGDIEKDMIGFGNNDEKINNDLPLPLIAFSGALLYVR